MSDLKNESQKLVDLVYAIRNIDLKALHEDYKYRENIQCFLDPTQWIKDADLITVYGKLIQAAIHFKDETQEIPFVPQK